MQATAFPVTRPLEYYRQERVLTVAQFAQFLGITEQTYRRLLRNPEKVRMETRRQVLERLDLSSPHYVRELAPRPTPSEIDQVVAIYTNPANEWYGYDPDTGEELGEVRNNAGELIRTYDPKVGDV